MTINDAEMRQNEFNSILDALNNYSPRAQKYIKAKYSLLNNAKNFYKGREKLLKALKKEYFHLNLMMNLNNGLVKKADANAFNEWINKKETDINKELFKKYLSFRRPSSMVKYLYQINDRKKNSELVSAINSGSWIKRHKERN